MQSQIHVKHTCGRLEPVSATLFEFSVGGDVVELAVHARVSDAPGWTVTHVASGSAACHFPDADVAAQLPIWGAEHAPVATALGALNTLVCRLGAARVRSVFASAKPLIDAGG